jgi:hypothetical protein
MARPTRARCPFRCPLCSRAALRGPSHARPLRRPRLAFDGNLHWNANPAVNVPADYFHTSRTHPLSEANKVHYPDGWDAHSIAGDPFFESFNPDFHETIDLRLQAESIARKAGVALPPEWPDPLRSKDGMPPDIGAFPFGAEPLKVGIDGRTVAGSVRR